MADLHHVGVEQAGGEHWSRGLRQQGLVFVSYVLVLYIILIQPHHMAAGVCPGGRTDLSEGSAPDFYGAKPCVWSVAPGLGPPSSRDRLALHAVLMPQSLIFGERELCA